MQVVTRAIITRTGNPNHRHAFLLLIPNGPSFQVHPLPIVCLQLKGAICKFTPSSVFRWHCSLDQKVPADFHVKDHGYKTWRKYFVMLCFTNTTMSNVCITMTWLSDLTSLCETRSGCSDYFHRNKLIGFKSALSLLSSLMWTTYSVKWKNLSCQSLFCSVYFISVLFAGSESTWRRILWRWSVTLHHSFSCLDLHAQHYLGYSKYSWSKYCKHLSCINFFTSALIR